MAKDKPSVVNGMFLALISMAVFSIAIMSENSSITGFVAANDNSQSINILDLKGFSDVNSLGELAPGKYYISSEGIVYYMDDSSRFAVAKIDYVDEVQKNRMIYIDDKGNIGYLIE
ncbi:MAG TPA: hypothetical protein VJI97_03375 [Candidatus Nanoarchaeia archaeon]|nr:hypothetical protein [Candidatus Nanoarchaeia archaeon]